MPTTRTTWIYADTRGVGPCRSCGAQMQWATLANMKHTKMPFDYPLVALRTRHEDGSGRLLEEVDLGTSHFATCPHAAQHRTRRS